MSLRQFEDFVYRAGFLDHDDPVAAWQDFGERLERVGGLPRRRARAADRRRGHGPALGVEGRTLDPLRRATELPRRRGLHRPARDERRGDDPLHVPGDLPGREVDDVRLRFEGGEVVEATAKRGQDLLREMIAMDEGARRVGEFAFGLNESSPRSRATCCSTRRSAAPSTWRSAGRIRRPAARTARPCTGTWSATSGRAARSTPTASSSTATARSSTARARSPDASRSSRTPTCLAGRGACPTECVRPLRGGA